MCSKEVGNPSMTDALRDEVSASIASERVISHLAALWDREPHDIEFLLATRSLHFLARVTSEEAWEQLLAETAGLLDPNLLYSAISWLQDSEQLELGLETSIVGE